MAAHGGGDLLWIRHEAYFRAYMERRLQVKSAEAINVCRKKLEQVEKRLTELDRLFVRLYEDNVAGRISDERFAMMSRGGTRKNRRS